MKELPATTLPAAPGAAGNETLQTRLRKLRESFGLTQAQMATQMRMKLRAYQTYETDGRSPRAVDIAPLAEMGINLNWLLTGTGEMLIAPVAEKLSPATLQSIEEAQSSWSPEALQQELKRDPASIRSNAPEELLGAMIADGISKAYKEVGIKVPTADLGRLTGQMIVQALMFPDAAQRPGFAAGLLAALRRDLQRPHNERAEDKRSA